MANPYQYKGGYYPQPFYPMTPMTQYPVVPQQPGQPPVSSPGNIGGGSQSGVNVPGMLPNEQSDIENILRLNKGKLVSVHATFENNSEWNAKIFNGIIEAAGRDHLILSQPETGNRVLIPMVYVDFITFSEPIEYEYPFGSGPLASAPPR